MNKRIKEAVPQNRTVYCNIGQVYLGQESRFHHVKFSV